MNSKPAGIAMQQYGVLDPGIGENYAHELYTLAKMAQLKIEKAKSDQQLPGQFMELWLTTLNTSTLLGSIPTCVYA